MGKNLSSAKTVLEVAEPPENQEEFSEESLQPTRSWRDVVQEKWPLPVFVSSILLLVFVVFGYPESENKKLTPEEYLRLAEKDFAAKNYEQTLFWTQAFGTVSGRQKYQKRITELAAESNYHLFLKSFLATDKFKSAEECYKNILTEHKPERGEYLLIQARFGQLYLNRALNIKSQQVSASEAIQAEYRDFLQKSLLAYTGKGTSPESLIDYFTGLQRKIIEEEREGVKRPDAAKTPVPAKIPAASANPALSIESEGPEMEKQVFQNLIKVYELLLEATPRQERDKDGKRFLSLDYAAQLNTQLGYLVRSQENTKTGEEEARDTTKLQWGRAALLLAQLEWMRFELEWRAKAVEQQILLEKTGGTTADTEKTVEKIHSVWKTIFANLENAQDRFYDIYKARSGKPIGAEAAFELGQTRFFFLKYATNLSKTLSKCFSALPKNTREMYEKQYIGESYNTAQSFLTLLVQKYPDTILGLKSRLFLGLLEYARGNYTEALQHFRDAHEAKTEELGGNPVRLAASFYAARCQKQLALNQLDEFQKNNVPPEDPRLQKAEKSYKNVFVSLKNLDASALELQANPWFDVEDFIGEVEEYANYQGKALDRVGWKNLNKRVELLDEAIDANKFLAQKFRQNRKGFLKKLCDTTVDKYKAINTFIDLSALFAEPETMRGEEARRYYDLRQQAYETAADAALRYGANAEINDRLDSYRKAADYYQEIGQYGRMLKVASQLASEERPENMIRLGKAWLGLGQYENAAEAFKKGLPKSGTHDVPAGLLPDNRYFLARTLFYQSRQATDPLKKQELVKNALARLHEITDDDSGVEPNAEYYLMAKLLMGEIHFQRAEDTLKEKNPEPVAVATPAATPATVAIAAATATPTPANAPRLEFVSADSELNETVKDLGSAIRRIEENIKNRAEERRREIKDTNEELTAFMDGANGLDVSHYYMLGEALLRLEKFNQSREAFEKLRNLYQPPQPGAPRWRSVNPWAPEWRLLALKRAASSYVIEGDELLRARKDKEADRCWQNAITQFDNIRISLNDSDPEETANLQRMIGDTFARYDEAANKYGPAYISQLEKTVEKLGVAANWYKKSTMQSKLGTVTTPLFRTKKESDTYEQWREFQKNMYDKMQQYSSRIKNLD